MKITYIGHSGFLAETETVSLLFDYWNGELPEIAEDKSLYIFASHRHQDHFNPEIFRLQGLPARTEYLLSYDILRNKRFYGKYPEAASARDEGRIHSLRMEESYCFGDLEVWPLKSTDEGVAFLIGIPAEKRLIYHAGDLNLWFWDGEPEDQNRYYTGIFRKEMKVLSALVRKHGYNPGGGEPKDSPPFIDLAFLPLDPRLEKYAFCGMDQYLQTVPMRTVFPMHCWEMYDVIDRYLEAREGAVEPLEPIHSTTMPSEPAQNTAMSSKPPENAAFLSDPAQNTALSPEPAKNEFLPSQPEKNASMSPGPISGITAEFHETEEHTAELPETEAPGIRMAHIRRRGEVYEV